MQDAEQLRKGIESILFVAVKPVTIRQLLEVFPDVEKVAMEAALQELQLEYNTAASGVHVNEVAGGFLLASNPDCVDYIRKHFKTKRIIRLSPPALETLAIIAYKQPVTRAEMEFIRGVNVDGVIKTLVDRDLIKTRGQKDVPGKPHMYVTTEEFLNYFGIRSLRDLPQLQEAAVEELEGISSVQPAAPAAPGNTPSDIAEALPDIPNGEIASPAAEPSLRAEVYLREFPDTPEEGAPPAPAHEDRHEHEEYSETETEH